MRGDNSPVTGFLLSALIHSALGIALTLTTLHTSTEKEERFSDKDVVIVDLITVSNTTNIKTMRRPPKPKEKPKSKQAVKPIKNVKTTPLSSITTKPTPKSKPPAPIPPSVKLKPVLEKPKTPKAIKPKKDLTPTKKVAKSKPLPKPATKPRPKHSELDGLLKGFNTSKPTATEKEPQKTSTNALDEALNDMFDKSYDETKPLSISETLAIRKQVEDRWVIPAGIKDAKEMKVGLYIELAADGRVLTVRPLDEVRIQTDPHFRIAAESAMRAVFAVEQFKGLPPEKYHEDDGWKALELHFDPSRVLY